MHTLAGLRVAGAFGPAGSRTDAQCWFTDARLVIDAPECTGAIAHFEIHRDSGACSLGEMAALRRIKAAMRVVIDRDDFGTSDFLVGTGEYAFQLNAIGLFLRARRG